MEPQRNTNATLVDLLDRVLDKGLVIHADLIVSVAGIPLIGVNLRAALAGMETMVKYGMMKEWDARIRAQEQDDRNEIERVLSQGEEIGLKMLGATFSREGIIESWRYGYLYLTGTRLLLFHENFGKVLFEVPLESIKGMVIHSEEHSVDNEKQLSMLVLLLEGDRVARLRALDVERLKGAVEDRLEDLGVELDVDPMFPDFEEKALNFLLPTW